MAGARAYHVCCVSTECVSKHTVGVVQVNPIPRSHLITPLHMRSVLDMWDRVGRSCRISIILPVGDGTRCGRMAHRLCAADRPRATRT